MVITGVLTKRRNFNAEIDPQRRDDIKRYDKKATHKPRREAWNNPVLTALGRH